MGAAFARRLAIGAAISVPLGLAGCALPREGASVPGNLPRAAIADLPGWNNDAASAALSAFQRSCAAILRMPADQTLGGDAAMLGAVTQAGDWHAACAASEAVPPGDADAARAFFQTDFDAYALANSATITGYFEPEFRGAKNKAPGYSVPLYGRPALPALADLPRVDIDAGALAGQAPVTAWLADPVDAFMLQIQGSGRILLPDGNTLRVTFDGQNGQPYTPIGRVLVQQGDLAPDQVSFQSIAAWLKANPDQAPGIMEQNQRYVFLKPLGGIADDLGAPGTLGVPLTPGRSLAVDAADIPLGAPVYVETTDPSGAALDRLSVAQDTGGGIHGAGAADLFFGAGDAAGAVAGAMDQPGRLIIFLPRPGLAPAEGDPSS